MICVTVKSSARKKRKGEFDMLEWSWSFALAAIRIVLSLACGVRMRDNSEADSTLLLWRSPRTAHLPSCRFSVIRLLRIWRIPC